MKRKLLLAFLGIAICGTALQAQTLDEAILNAAFAISRDLPSGATVAVVSVRSDSGKLSEYALNELYGAILRNHKVVPVKPNESQLQAIRELNALIVPNSESASSLAQLLKAPYLVTGSITGSGSVYRIQFTAVDQNGNPQSQYAASLNPQSDSQLASLLGGSSAGAAPGVMQIPTSAASIAGVKHPVAGRVPVTKISEKKQYTGKVSWLPVVNGTFNEKTQYTAIITLTAKAGYTLQGVPANFFTVARAKMVSNPVNSGIITAVFPATGAYPLGSTGPGGGKIFYYSSAGFTMTDTNQVCHYLEAAPDNMSSSLTWASSGYYNTDIAGTGTAIGAGRKNTDLILATDANAPAAKACKDYRGPNNLTDWFLPSITELNTLYTNRSYIGNMGTNLYWSSSQNISSSAWYQYFTNGDQNYSYKGNYYYVRAIRAF